MGLGFRVWGLWAEMEPAHAQVLYSDEMSRNRMAPKARNDGMATTMTEWQHHLLRT